MMSLLLTHSVPSMDTFKDFRAHTAMELDMDKMEKAGNTNGDARERRGRKTNSKRGNCSNCAVCDEFIYRKKVHYGGKVLNLFTVQIMILIGVIVLWNYQI